MSKSRGAGGQVLPCYRRARAEVTGVCRDTTPPAKRRPKRKASSTTALPVPPAYVSEHEARILAEQARVEVELRRLGQHRDQLRGGRPRD